MSVAPRSIKITHQLTSINDGVGHRRGNQVDEKKRQATEGDMDKNGQPEGNGAGAPTESEHQAPTVGSSGQFENAQFPGWQEFLDFMELSKSRLLEDQSALQLLSLLEPRIGGESCCFFEPHYLFLTLDAI
ncbi:hypothetical protein DHEL01_v211876 [Diaporthe helianthi]|uniref:Uncharacterized protein n=1 Tax=Diaporthe helianthi TaxID=158607 RepID=A0A2P5HHL8_DIAHE|nr:hypothetical protein DHEL01_v211876 [Diaporthe helianthi]